MNVWRGSFRNFFLLFSLIYLSNFAAANTHCFNPITENDIARQCDNMISNFKLDTQPSVAVEQVVQSILGVVNIGDKGTFGLDRRYRVSRIEIALFGESEEELFFDELRNYGDHLNRDLILVKSCQGTDEDKPGDSYATASVQIFLEEIDEYSVTMMAKETDIYSGESSVLSLKLSETGCPKEGETITLRKEGPGSLPNGVETNKQGRAQVQFKGEEEGLKMFVLFKLKPKTVMVFFNEKAGVKTPSFENFERRFRFPREEILTGEPFAINFEEPGAGDIHSDVDIRFSPRKVTFSEGGGVP